MDLFTLKRSKNYPWASNLTHWFAAAKRRMPWRETRDPYRIWLSEIMLQQTQVATVIPYYERFLLKFPSVDKLAAAHQDEVLKLWAGLGYYSRARNLHRGAQAIVERFEAAMPRTPETIREIPGIGDYTAGAILSIAFDLPEALVDGNVARVFSRLLLLESDWRGGEGKKAVWKIAREAIAEAHAAGVNPGDYNQALMELGATVCTPRSPHCSQCPIAEYCSARKAGVQDLYPKLKAKTASPEWNLRAWVVRNNGKILFGQRGDDGLFGGMWEVPTERLEVPAESALRPFARMTHVLTHRVLNVAAIEIELPEWRRRFSKNSDLTCWSGAYTKFRWLRIEDARNGSVALSAVQAKILALCAEKVPLFD